MIVKVDLLLNVNEETFNYIYKYDSRKMVDVILEKIKSDIDNDMIDVIVASAEIK